MEYLTEIIEYISGLFGDIDLSSIFGDIDLSSIFGSIDLTEIFSNIYNFFVLIADMFTG